MATRVFFCVFFLYLSLKIALLKSLQLCERNSITLNWQIAILPFCEQYSHVWGRGSKPESFFWEENFYMQRNLLASAIRNEEMKKFPNHNPKYELNFKKKWILSKATHIRSKKVQELNCFLLLHRFSIYELFNLWLVRKKFGALANSYGTKTLKFFK